MKKIFIVAFLFGTILCLFASDSNTSLPTDGGTALTDGGTDSNNTKKKINTTRGISIKGDTGTPIKGDTGTSWSESNINYFSFQIIEHIFAIIGLLSLCFFVWLGIKKKIADNKKV